MERYHVTKDRRHFAIKKIEDNNNLLLLRREIAFQIRSQCPNIADVYDTYYYDDKIWVRVFSRRNL